MLALAPSAVCAQGGEVQKSWAELSREVEAELESLVPRLESLESLKRALNKEEKEELAVAYELLQPRVHDLQFRGLWKYPSPVIRGR